MLTAVKEENKRGLLSQPKVSIILPSLNVVNYIEECVESVISQTLSDIEIICVDAGSEDGTLEILHKYAKLDPRIQVLVSDKKSYGLQMNMGIKAARGEYVGIVETDDYVSREMYGDLYEIARKHNLDFIKADFYRFTNEDGKLNLVYNQLTDNLELYGRVLNPQENLELFNLIMNTWSGIYKRQFILEHQIWHNETPGASYQDNGFWFKTFALAQRVYFCNKPYYMNRRDNPNSSIYNKSKVYCMNEEYAYIMEFLNTNLDLKRKLLPVYCYHKYKNYMFTYNRIDEKFKLGYIVRFSEEFSEDYEAGNLDRELFGERSWKNMMAIITDPLKFYIHTSKYVLKRDNCEARLIKAESEIKRLNEQIGAIYSSTTYKVGERVTYIPRKCRGFCNCCKDHGIVYTLHRAIQKAFGSC